ADAGLQSASSPHRVVISKVRVKSPLPYSSPSTTQAALIFASMLKGLKIPKGELVSVAHLRFTWYQVAFQSLGFSLCHRITSWMHWANLLSEGMSLSASVTMGSISSMPSETSANEYRPATYTPP